MKKEVNEPDLFKSHEVKRDFILHRKYFTCVIKRRNLT